MATPKPELAGIHHVRLPVADLAHACRFWTDILGYERNFDFPGPDGPRGWAIAHPCGGPNIVLWRDPGAAGASAGFPWFSIGMKSADEIRELAATLDRHGVPHGGVQDALVGIKLPFVQIHDGHLIGFYEVNGESD